ncbi:methylated-DNA--[protein]-cysteine S-methyltransferase [Alphaproteobacteria bacterium]|nr:methylated-DNA--[protein]-cysteine S-methyltransferase [Alphaproteobacteria bacterium]
MLNQSFYFEEINTKIGNIFILENQKGICVVSPLKDARVKTIKTELNPRKGLVYYKKIKLNIIRFLDQREKLFKFPINFIYGTNFQISVWKQLIKIPYGSFSTYSLIASKIKNMNAVRAVGNAVGKNPVMIYVPCHRVLTKSGNLGGYAWGASLKQDLLDIENIKKDG